MGGGSLLVEGQVIGGDLPPGERSGQDTQPASTGLINQACHIFGLDSYHVPVLCGYFPLIAGPPAAPAQPLLLGNPPAAGEDPNTLPASLPPLRHPHPLPPPPHLLPPPHGGGPHQAEALVPALVIKASKSSVKSDQSFLLAPPLPSPPARPALPRPLLPPPLRHHG